MSVLSMHVLFNFIWRIVKACGLHTSLVSVEFEHTTVVYCLQVLFSAFESHKCPVRTHRVLDFPDPDPCMCSLIMYTFKKCSYPTKPIKSAWTHKMMDERGEQMSILICCIRMSLYCSSYINQTWEWCQTDWTCTNDLSHIVTLSTKVMTQSTHDNVLKWRVSTVCVIFLAYIQIKRTLQISKIS